MGLRQRQWAARRRQVILDQLGERCAHCSSTKDLEFDCIQSPGDWHHNIEWSWRMSFYNRMLKEGNLQILCRICHSKKSNRTHVETPF